MLPLSLSIFQIATEASLVNVEHLPLPRKKRIHKASVVPDILVLQVSFLLRIFHQHQQHFLSTYRIAVHVKRYNRQNASCGTYAFSSQRIRYSQIYRILSARPRLRATLK